MTEIKPTATEVCTPKGVTISTGSRLHFGLLSFGSSLGTHLEAKRFQDAGKQPLAFGGIGVMLQAPRTTIEFRRCRRFEVTGDRFGRADQFVGRWLDFINQSNSFTAAGLGRLEELPLQISVQSQPPEHAGLGAGTQLALSLAHGLFQYFFQTTVDPKTLAISVGRGLRSAVGTHGFYRGGFIVDRGKSSPSALGILDGHFPIPDAWRIVLISPRDRSGSIFGQKEVDAFRSIPEIPAGTTSKLTSLIDQQIVPSLAAVNFDQFSRGIFEYGYTAGKCFESVQGGPFANRQSEAIVDFLRSQGVEGVGQSSWGPTLFAFARSHEQAEQICQSLQSSAFGEQVTAMVQQCKNTGVDAEIMR